MGDKLLFQSASVTFEIFEARVLLLVPLLSEILAQDMKSILAVARLYIAPAILMARCDSSSVALLLDTLDAFTRTRARLNGPTNAPGLAQAGV
jgi:hypothetical protein